MNSSDNKCILLQGISILQYSNLKFQQNLTINIGNIISWSFSNHPFQLKIILQIMLNYFYFQLYTILQLKSLLTSLIEFIEKVNTIWMNQTNYIVTPLLNPITLSEISSDAKLSSQDRPEDNEDKNINSASLNILGYSVSSTFSLTRKSAFSIYDPNIESQSNKKELESSEKSQSQQEKQRQHKRTWKREKKDKREQSRLETKNLNRYFRSKINQMLRDIKQNPKDQAQSIKADEILEMLNKSNKIMFSQIRQIIKDEWLKKKLLCCSGVLLKYIHGGKMGMQSKLIMLKYFNKIQKAIRNPDKFTCWK